MTGAAALPALLGALRRLNFMIALMVRSTMEEDMRATLATSAWASSLSRTSAGARLRRPESSRNCSWLVASG